MIDEQLWKDHENRITKLENSESEQNIQIALNKKDYEYVKKTIDKTEQGVEDIKRMLTDHIQEPVKQLNSLKWAIITAIVLGVVGYFVKFN